MQYTNISRDDLPFDVLNKKTLVSLNYLTCIMGAFFEIVIQLLVLYHRRLHRINLSQQRKQEFYNAERHLCQTSHTPESQIPTCLLTPPHPYHHLFVP